MTTPILRRTRAIAVATVLGTGLLLTGCGGGGGGSDTAGPGKTPAELARDLERNGNDNGTTDGGDDQTDDGGARVGTLTFLPPESVDPPAGFTTVKDACEADTRYGAYVQYAVPTGWEITGRGMGGTGRTLDGNIDHTFTTENGKVTVALELDSRDDQGAVLNGEGEPDERFDYQYSSGDDVTNVRFAKAFTATVGGEKHQVWTIDEATYPNVVRGVEYRVRVALVDMTWPASGRLTTSFALVVSGDPADVDEATVQSIIETLAIPACVRTSVTIQGEVMTSADLDEDGRVSTGADLQEDLAR